jgi:transposase InsO family protein
VPAQGSCTIGNGDKLSYVETGILTKNNKVTVVDGLEFDLYSAVDAAKRGISAVIDFDPATGENRSFTYCKDTGEISPLVERRHGALEVPVHLFLSRKNTVGLIASDAKPLPTTPGIVANSPCIPIVPSPKVVPPSQQRANKAQPPPYVQATRKPIPVLAPQTPYRPYQLSAFWNSFDSRDLSLVCRGHNSTDASLFTFDVVHSLNQRDRDFLIHARLAHLPSNKIVQLIKNGNGGLPFSGKLLDLCRPCMESKQRASAHGRHTNRHPDGRIGEHLHSDLAIVNTKDYSGFKYVLTAVDEISDEVLAILLKDKTADTVLAACKRIHAIVTSRANSKLKTWQFDRGSEFLNKEFDEWIHEQLGAKQLFSNIEHPWENGRAERSFQTLFAKARSMMKYADLPTDTWGRAILHAVYLKNRSPSTRLHGISPLQFRTGSPVDFSKLRLFGSPAQIFIRPSKRNSTKLSNRSEHGTCLGMSSKGNGYIFRVNRHNTTVEVDSKDAMFNETFKDVWDRKGHLVRGGVVLPPDLHTTQESEEQLPSQDGVIAPPALARPLPLSNRFEPLSDSPSCGPKPITPKADKPMSAPATSTTVAPTLSTNTPPPHRNWKYVPDLGPTGKGDRTNDGPKLASFFQVPDSQRPGYNTRRNRNTASQSSNPTLSPTKVLSALMQSPDVNEYNPELDILLSCLESKIPPGLCLLSSARSTALHQTFPVDLEGRDPKSQKEIDNLPPDEAKRFNDATLTEFNGMKKKQVMELLPISRIPKDAKIYPSVVNWTTKKVLGVYSKTKCRICFGGHRYNKAYTDCFAPTVNFTSVLMILCLGTMLGWSFGSIDYSQAYLNADIDELCIMRAPEFLREFDVNGEEQYWRLKKVIYGHPKGSRLWADCLHRKLVQLGFSQFKTDQCAYAKWDNWDISSIVPSSTITVILVHSDDLIIASNNPDNLQRIKTQLLRAFEGVDQGDLTSFCGVEIKASPDSMELSMDYYWDKLLKKFNVGEHDLQDTPLKTKIIRSDCPEQVDKSRQKEYLQIMGSIIYGYTHCRLDLAYAVGMLTRVMHSPSANHLVQLRNLLKYINKTKSMRMTYHRDPTVQYGMDFVFHGSVDSSHADDPDTMRSTGGWFFFLRQGQGSISAKSGQSPDVALSSTESETIWACSAATQGAYIKQFLDELCLFRSVTFELHEDSQPAINAQRRNVSQSKFRHIKTKYYYIRQLIYDGWAKMVKIDTKNQVADMATKILSAIATMRFTDMVLGHS